jgi:putative phosphoesterase
MTDIFIFSDTHSYLDARLEKYIAKASFVIHAGDIGDLDLSARVSSSQILKVVYGNIDSSNFRKQYPEFEVFSIEQIKVLLIHIAGSMPNYNAKVKKMIDIHQPDWLICGHSHIVKIAEDKVNNLLYINPGACGNHGFHQIKTALWAEVEGKKIIKLNLIELGKRGE